MSRGALAVVQPGDSIGLAFGQRATLVLRETGPGGAPVASSRLTFAIATDLPNESAGGSTLSLPAAVTDETGMARVDVVAGAAAASFRVRIQGDDTGALFVTVSVSDAGFSSLEVVPVHVGLREVVGPLEVRLYPGARCGSMKAEAPPASPYPPREAGFGHTAVWEALSPAGDYSVLGWVMSPGGPVDVDGCIDLAPRQLRAGARVRLLLPVADRPIEAADRYTAASTFDLSPLRAWVLPASAVWSRARCPRAAAELLLDCAIDALDDSDPLDCTIVSPGPAASALLAARGPLDEAGCRSAGGPMTIDTRLTRVLSSTVVANLPAAATALFDLLDTLSLESSITLAEPGARQQLGRATLEQGGTLVHTLLPTTARPVIAATSPALRHADTDEVELGPFRYTLRLGTLVASALEPMVGDVKHLGQSLAAAARAGSQTGCVAVSTTVCQPAGLASDCLVAACNLALPALDAQLAEPFIRLDGQGYDFTLEGSAVLMDLDHDFEAEQLLGGSWTATARLSGGEELRLLGVFQATKQKR